MINKRTKRVLMILPFLLIIVGVIMLLFPGMMLGICPEEPTCDGSNWNSQSGHSVTLSAGKTIVAIKIHAGGLPVSDPITSDGNYGNVVQVGYGGWPDPSCWDSPNFYSYFVLSSASYPAGYGWFGQYEVSGIGTNSVNVNKNKLFSWNDCILPDVSSLDYICTGDTTTTTEPTTTTTTQPTTTTTQPTTTTTQPTTTTTQPTTTTTQPTTTTTQPTTTTTTPGTTTTTTPGTTTTTAPGTTTTTTPGTTTTTTPRRGTTTTTAAGTFEVLGIQELPFTGYDSLWYVVGAILISLGILTGTFSLSTVLKRK